MSALLARLARQLALVPLTAFVVYQLVALLPLGADSEAKTVQLRSVHRQLKEDLGVGTPLGFLRPWERFVTGQSLDQAHTPTVDAGFVLRKLAGSLRIGGLALLLALLWGGAFAAARTLAPWPALGAVLDLGPALVFGIPAFVLAIGVVLVTGQCLDPAEAWAYEPAAALVASIGPGAFLGTLLRDARLRTDAR